MEARLQGALSTLTKIFSVFGCKGQTLHVMSGLQILRAFNGYVCPHCGAEIEDISGTPVGKAFFAWHRPDLTHEKTSPAPSKR